MINNIHKTFFALIPVTILSIGFSFQAEQIKSTYSEKSLNKNSCCQFVAAAFRKQYLQIRLLNLEMNRLQGIDTYLNSLRIELDSLKNSMKGYRIENFDDELECCLKVNFKNKRFPTETTEMKLLVASEIYKEIYELRDTLFFLSNDKERNNIIFYKKNNYKISDSELRLFNQQLHKLLEDFKISLDSVSNNCAVQMKFENGLTPFQSQVIANRYRNICFEEYDDLHTYLESQDFYKKFNIKLDSLIFKLPEYKIQKK